MQSCDFDKTLKLLLDKPSTPMSLGSHKNENSFLEHKLKSNKNNRAKPK